MATNEVSRNVDVGDLGEIDGIDEIGQIGRIEKHLGS